ncbi:chemotaxis response regulator protein-glutamate methylesterase [Alteromonas sediminis]|uniref:Protein-glutamate methylesterase/protein-glutamine glutaminase n=1 Tax=Alteromonas sediminis TaxID=2259342 RepID=A0A3N5YJW0_9ALTE|nr:chemotaxis response regulator protein-glutamate methylesterase [Alteromonas sediminis]RPJ65021.1 chemotaxis response regulator protein-glutamate methylesterase [Alteromonas sediminis]
MAFKVLVVDDSTFYRRRLRMILEEDRELHVVGEAKDGQEAIRLIKELSPDVVTMDVEMPVMDGISAVKSIMKTTPVPILMFSSLTHAGAQATLDALEAGALDFLPKKFEDIAKNTKEAGQVLRTKARTLARRKAFMRASTPAAPPRNSGSSRDSIKPPKQTFMRSSSVLTGQKHTAAQVSVTDITRSGKFYRCVAIGASTGGPVALQTVLSGLPKHFPLPILVIQHMPGTFTKAFAERLNGQCEIDVLHAASGDVLKPGVAYIAPGGKQCVVQSKGTSSSLVIRDALNNEISAYKPSVDITFTSLEQTYGGEVLGVILTGMGSDGMLGSEKLKAAGATIWAQDQATSVVYGMPQAVASKGISSHSISLSNIAQCLRTELGC